MLQLFLRKRTIGIQHVGSTSVPGMVARSIIDILVAIPDYEQGFDIVRIIERIGYAYHGANNRLQQHFFDKGQPVKYVLYAVEVDGETWIDRIAFRDYLRENSDIMHSYAEFKQQLSKQFASNLKAYQGAKGEFVKRTLQKLRES